ncbi:UDP-glucose 6-dehydrogenase (plasmid) [Roseovarius sp. THAF27]|nr:UDP-glucose 6-dehydrogenase [Roseovarius sp. THAF27]QFT99931.1 UDP-glucose 6-dehydrogenase [Roseovarius sp. THAF8]
MAAYEPEMSDLEFFGSKVMHDLAAFKAESDIILAKRTTPDLKDVADKVFTRDLFGSD